MASNMFSLDDQIQQLQKQLQILQNQRDAIQAATIYTNSMRPAGIPPSWKPRFDGTPPNVTVYAWYDPNKLGDF